MCKRSTSCEGADLSPAFCVPFCVRDGEAQQCAVCSHMGLWRLVSGLWLPLLEKHPCMQIGKQRAGGRPRERAEDRQMGEETGISRRDQR